MFVKPNPKLIKFLARAPQSQALPIRKAIRNLSELTKLKLSVLNSIVTVSAYCLYPVPISCIPLFFSSLALSMSTQVLNQTIEAEYDKLMVRTSQRPMVQNIFSRPFALGLGSALGAAGIYGLSWYSAKTAIIGAVIWVGYLAVYTRMKRHSLINTYF
jgi:protoheme IX farnesyltransferase